MPYNNGMEYFNKVKRLKNIYLMLWAVPVAAVAVACAYMVWSTAVFGGNGFGLMIFLMLLFSALPLGGVLVILFFILYLIQRSYCRLCEQILIYGITETERLCAVNRLTLPALKRKIFIMVSKCYLPRVNADAGYVALSN